MIAEIVFPIPLHRTFYYRVPTSIIEEGKSLRGLRANVPFGRRLAKGLIVAVHRDNEVNLSRFFQVKEIDFLIDKKPLFGDGFVDLILWISKKWNCPLGLVFASFYVPVKNLQSDEILKEPDGIDIEIKIDNPDFKKALYPFQEDAAEKISGYIGAGKKKTVLLYGPPKSGKTEIYARAIKAALESGGQTLWLVPDIHQINPVLKELKAKFPSVETDLWHSKITPKRRLETWKKIARGEAKIIIGARSAAMLPFKRLNLAIIDEEHDDMYKQEETEPHFHARDIILKRAEAHESCVILGSSCPSMESFNSTLTGVAELIELKPDIENSFKPLFEIVDSKMYPAKIISDPLVDKIKDRLEKKEQTLLIVNRKGFSFSVNCVKCGWKKYCPKCGVPMTVRKDLKTGEKIFFCWRCSKKESVPDKCPKCLKKFFRQSGIGTQRLEDEVRELFPGAKVFRFDGTTGIKFSPDDMNDTPDIIIGTRIVARGYNFPKMSLVGVLSPEIDSSPADFRSAEKMFQMLLEASGRLSREISGGELLIQTNDPDYYVLPAFINSDYKKFALEEIKMREKFSYPPFSNMARVTVSGKDSKKIEKFLDSMIALVESDKESDCGDIEILGPLGASASKSRVIITESLILRGKEENSLLSAVKKIRAKKVPKGFIRKVFVAPYNFK